MALFTKKIQFTIQLGQPIDDLLRFSVDNDLTHTRLALMGAFLLQQHILSNHNGAKWNPLGIKS